MDPTLSLGDGLNNTNSTVGEVPESFLELSELSLTTNLIWWSSAGFLFLTAFIAYSGVLLARILNLFSSCLMRNSGASAPKLSYHKAAQEPRSLPSQSCTSAAPPSTSSLESSFCMMSEWWTPIALCRCLMQCVAGCALPRQRTTSQELCAIAPPQVVSVLWWIHYAPDGSPDPNRLEVYLRGLRIVAWNAAGAYESVQNALLQACHDKVAASQAPQSAAPQAPTTEGPVDAPSTPTSIAKRDAGMPDVTVGVPMGPDLDEGEVAAALANVVLPWIFQLSPRVNISVTHASFVAAGKHLPCLLYATWQRSLTVLNASLRRSALGSTHIRYTTSTTLSSVEADIVRNPAYNSDVYRSIASQRASTFSRLWGTLRQMLRDATTTTTLPQEVERGGPAPSRRGTWQPGRVPSHHLRGDSNDDLQPSLRRRALQSGQSSGHNRAVQSVRDSLFLRQSTHQDPPRRAAASMPVDMGHVGGTETPRTVVSVEPSLAGDSDSDDTPDAVGRQGSMAGAPPRVGSGASGSGGASGHSDGSARVRWVGADDGPVSEGAGTHVQFAGGTDVDEDELHNGTESGLLDPSRLEAFLVHMEASVSRLVQPRMLDISTAEVTLTQDTGAVFGPTPPAARDLVAHGPQYVLDVRLLGGDQDGEPVSAAQGAGTSIQSQAWTASPKVYYGPWHDRHRKMLQAYFAPSTVTDTPPWRPAAGDAQVALQSRTRIAVSGPLVFTVPYACKRAHPLTAIGLAAADGECGRRASRSPEAHSPAEGGARPPAWVDPATKTLRPDVLVKTLLDSLQGSQAAQERMARGRQRGQKAEEYALNPDHLQGLSEEEVDSIPALIRRWQDLGLLCQSCGPEADAAARQRSLSHLVLRVHPATADGTGVSGAGSQLSLFLDLVADNVAWNGDSTFTDTRGRLGRVEACLEGDVTPFLVTQEVGLDFQYTTPRRWRQQQTNRMGIQLAAATLSPTTAHVEAIGDVLGDFSAPLDFPWVPPSLIPWSTLGPKHEAGKALFIPYLGLTSLAMPDAMIVLHANGHNAVDVTGDVGANTLLSLAFPVLTADIRSEVTEAEPQHYSMQYSIMGGCVDEELMRTHHKYSVQSRVATAAAIIKQRRVAAGLTGSDFSGGLSGAARQPDGRSQGAAQTTGANTPERQTVDVPCIVASFPGYHPATRSRGVTGFDVQVAEFPLLSIASTYTYAVGEGTDALGVDVTLHDPTVHATPHGMAALLAAISNYAGASRFPTTSQNLQADGGCNAHTHRVGKWGYNISPSAPSAALSTLVGFLHQLASPLAGPHASQHPPIFLTRGTGPGLTQGLTEWWNAHPGGLSTTDDTGTSAHLPAPVPIGHGCGMLHAVPVPLTEMVTTLTVHLPNVTALIPLLPEGPLTPIDPVLYAFRYSELDARWQAKPTSACMVRRPTPHHLEAQCGSLRVELASSYASSSLNINTGPVTIRAPRRVPTEPAPASPDPPPVHLHRGRGRAPRRSSSAAWNRRSVSPLHRQTSGFVGGSPPQRQPWMHHEAQGQWVTVASIGDIAVDMTYRFASPVQGMLGPLVTYTDDMSTSISNVGFGASLQQTAAILHCALQWYDAFNLCSDPTLTSPSAAPVLGTVQVSLSGRTRLAEHIAHACAAGHGGKYWADGALEMLRCQGSLLALSLHATERAAHEDLSIPPLKSVATSRVLNSSVDRDSAEETGVGGVLPPNLLAGLRMLLGSDQDPSSERVQAVLQEVRDGIRDPSAQHLRRFMGATRIVGVFLVFHHAGHTTRTSVLPLDVHLARKACTDGVDWGLHPPRAVPDIESVANLVCGHTFKTSNPGSVELPVRFPWAPLHVAAYALREVQWVAFRRRTCTAAGVGGAYDVDLSCHVHPVLLGSRAERIQCEVGGLGSKQGAFSSSPVHADSSPRHPLTAHGSQEEAKDTQEHVAHRRTQHSHQEFIAAQLGSLSQPHAMPPGDEDQSPYSTLAALTFGADPAQPGIAARLQGISADLSAPSCRPPPNREHREDFPLEATGTVTKGQDPGSVSAKSDWELIAGGQATVNAGAALRVPLTVLWTPSVPPDGEHGAGQSAASAPKSSARPSVHSVPLIHTSADPRRVTIAETAAIPLAARGGAREQVLSEPQQVFRGAGGVVEGSNRRHVTSSSRGPSPIVSRSWNLGCMLPYLWPHAAYAVGPTETNISIDCVQATITEPSSGTLVSASLCKPLQVAWTSRASDQYASRWQVHADAKASLHRVLNGYSARIPTAALRLNERNPRGWDAGDWGMDEGMAQCQLLLAEVASCRLPIALVMDECRSPYALPAPEVVGLQAYFLGLADAANEALAALGTAGAPDRHSRLQADLAENGMGLLRGWPSRGLLLENAAQHGGGKQGARLTDPDAHAVWTHVARAQQAFDAAAAASQLAAFSREPFSLEEEASVDSMDVPEAGDPALATPGSAFRHVGGALDQWGSDTEPEPADDGWFSADEGFSTGSASDGRDSPASPWAIFLDSAAHSKQSALLKEAQAKATLVNLDVKGTAGSTPSGHWSASSVRRLQHISGKPIPACTLHAVLASSRSAATSGAGVPLHGVHRGFNPGPSSRFFTSGMLGDDGLARGAVSLHELWNDPLSCSLLLVEDSARAEQTAAATEPTDDHPLELALDQARLRCARVLNQTPKHAVHGVDGFNFLVVGAACTSRVHLAPLTAALPAWQQALGTQELSHTSASARALTLRLMSQHGPPVAQHSVSWAVAAPHISISAGSRCLVDSGGSRGPEGAFERAPAWSMARFVLKDAFAAVGTNLKMQGSGAEGPASMSNVAFMTLPHTRYELESSPASATPWVWQEEEGLAVPVQEQHPTGSGDGFRPSAAGEEFGGFSPDANYVTEPQPWTGDASMPHRANTPAAQHYLDVPLTASEDESLTLASGTFFAGSPQLLLAGIVRGAAMDAMWGTPGTVGETSIRAEVAAIEGHLAPAACSIVQQVVSDSLALSSTVSQAACRVAAAHEARMQRLQDLLLRALPWGRLPSSAWSGPDGEGAAMARLRTPGLRSVGVRFADLMAAHASMAAADADVLTQTFLAALQPHGLLPLSRSGTAPSGDQPKPSSPDALATSQEPAHAAPNGSYASPITSPRKASVGGVSLPHASLWKQHGPHVGSLEPGPAARTQDVACTISHIAKRVSEECGGVLSRLVGLGSSEPLYAAAKQHLDGAQHPWGEIVPYAQPFARAPHYIALSGIIRSVFGCYPLPDWLGELPFLHVDEGCEAMQNKARSVPAFVQRDSQQHSRDLKKFVDLWIGESARSADSALGRAPSTATAAAQSLPATLSLTLNLAEVHLRACSTAEMPAAEHLSPMVHPAVGWSQGSQTSSSALDAAGAAGLALAITGVRLSHASGNAAADAPSQTSIAVQDTLLQASPDIHELAFHAAAGRAHVLTRQSLAAAEHIPMPPTEAPAAAPASVPDTAVLLSLGRIRAHALYDGRAWGELEVGKAFASLAGTTFTAHVPILTADIAGVLRHDAEEVVSVGGAVRDVRVQGQLAPSGLCVGMSVNAVKSHVPLHALQTDSATSFAAEWLQTLATLHTAALVPASLPVPPSQATRQSSFFALLGIHRAHLLLNKASFHLQLTPTLGCQYDLSWLQASASAVAPAHGHPATDAVRMHLRSHAVEAQRRLKSRLSGRRQEDQATPHRLKLPPVSAQVVREVSEDWAGEAAKIQLLLRFEEADFSVSQDLVSELLQVQASLQGEIERALGVLGALQEQWAAHQRPAQGHDLGATSSSVRSAFPVQPAEPSLGALEVILFQPAFKGQITLPIEVGSAPQACSLRVQTGMQVLHVCLPPTATLDSLSVRYHGTRLASSLWHHVAEEHDLSADFSGLPRSLAAPSVHSAAALAAGISKQGASHTLPLVFGVGGIPLKLLPQDSSLVAAASAAAAGLPHAYRTRAGSDVSNGHMEDLPPALRVAGFGVLVPSPAQGAQGDGKFLDGIAGGAALAWRATSDVSFSYAPKAAPSADGVPSTKHVKLAFDKSSVTLFPSAPRVSASFQRELTERFAQYIRHATELQQSTAPRGGRVALPTKIWPADRPASPTGRNHHAAPAAYPGAEGGLSDDGLAGLWYGAGSFAALPAVTAAVSVSRAVLTLPFVEGLPHLPATSARQAPADVAPSEVSDCMSLAVEEVLLEAEVSQVSQPSGYELPGRAPLKLPLGFANLSGTDFGVAMKANVSNLAILSRPRWSLQGWVAQGPSRCKYDRFVRPGVDHLLAEAAQQHTPEDPSDPGKQPDEHVLALRNVMLLPALSASVSVALAGVPTSHEARALVFCAGGVSAAAPVIRVSPEVVIAATSCLACWQATAAQLDRTLGRLRSEQSAPVDLSHGDEYSPSLPHPRTFVGGASNMDDAWWINPIVAVSLTVVVGGGFAEFLGPVAASDADGASSGVLQRLPMPAATVSLEGFSHVGDSSAARIATQRLAHVPLHNVALLQLHCGPIEVSHSLFAFWQETFAAYNSMRGAWRFHRKWLAAFSADTDTAHMSRSDSKGATAVQRRGHGTQHREGSAQTSATASPGAQQTATKSWLAALPRGMALKLLIDAEGQQPEAHFDGQGDLKCRITCAPVASDVWCNLYAGGPMTLTAAVVHDAAGGTALSALVCLPRLEVKLVSSDQAAASPSGGRSAPRHRPRASSRLGTGESIALHVVVHQLTLPASLTDRAPLTGVAGPPSVSGTLHVNSIETTLDCNQIDAIMSFQTAWVYNLLQAQALLQSAFGAGPTPRASLDPAAEQPDAEESAPVQGTLQWLRDAQHDARLLLALDTVRVTSHMERAARVTATVLVEETRVAVAMLPLVQALLARQRSFCAFLCRKVLVASRGDLWSVGYVQDSTLFLEHAVDDDVDLRGWQQEQQAQGHAEPPDAAPLAKALRESVALTVGGGVAAVKGSMYSSTGHGSYSMLGDARVFDEAMYLQRPPQSSVCLAQVDLQEGVVWMEDDPSGALEVQQSLSIDSLAMLVTPEAIRIPSEKWTSLNREVLTAAAREAINAVSSLARQLDPHLTFTSSASTAAQEPARVGPGGMPFAGHRGGTRGAPPPPAHPALRGPPFAARGRTILQIRELTAMLYGSAPVPGYVTERLAVEAVQVTLGLRQMQPGGEAGNIERLIVHSMQSFETLWQASSNLPSPPATPLANWSVGFSPASSSIAAVVAGASGTRSDTILRIPRYKITLQTSQAVVQSAGGQLGALRPQAPDLPSMPFGVVSQDRVREALMAQAGLLGEGVGASGPPTDSVCSADVQYVFQSSFAGDIVASTNLDRYTGSGLTPRTLFEKFTPDEHGSKLAVSSQAMLNNLKGVLGDRQRAWESALAKLAGPEAAAEALRMAMASSRADPTPTQPPGLFFKPDYSRHKVPFKFKPRLNLANLDIAFLLRQAGVMSDTMLPESLFVSAGVPLMHALALGGAWLRWDPGQSVSTFAARLQRLPPEGPPQRPSARLPPRGAAHTLPPRRLHAPRTRTDDSQDSHHHSLSSSSRGKPSSAAGYRMRKKARPSQQGQDVARR